MNIEQLKNRDYYLVIDKSGSMGTVDCPGNKSRWDACQESTMAIANKLQEYDPDGISVGVFSGSSKLYPNTTPDKVAQVFAENQPMGSTNLAGALEAIFADYNKAKAAGQTKANGAIALIVTDGVPDDEGAVAKSIINFGNSLANADAEFGLSFIQIGRDQHASEYLKRLDDHLTAEGAKFDIVDTKTFEEVENVGLTEALIAALTD